jgi:hypothetical protein
LQAITPVLSSHVPFAEQGFVTAQLASGASQNGPLTPELQVQPTTPPSVQHVPAWEQVDAVQLSSGAQIIPPSPVEAWKPAAQSAQVIPV